MSVPVNPHEFSIQEAFDRHSEAYDRRFTSPFLGEHLRAEVWKIAENAFGSAGRLLDLGSGTGEDAIHFARRGIQVTAVDISSRMMDRLRAKSEAAGVSPRIDCVTAEMSRYIPSVGGFDGIISNFGAVNCVRDLTWLRTLSHRALRPGAKVVLTAMGSFFPLETAIFLMKGNFRQAFRRFRKPCHVTIEGVSVAVYFHSPREMRAMLGSDFQLERIVGLRAFLPVPGLDHLQRYRLLQTLSPLDRVWCRWPATAAWADHFVSVWRFH